MNATTRSYHRSTAQRPSMVRVLPYMPDSRDRWELPLTFGTTLAGREAKLEPSGLSCVKTDRSERRSEASASFRGRHLGIDPLLDTSLGYFGSGSVSILSTGRLPALIPANSRPSSFVEIIQQHLCAHFCDGNRPGEFDAPCEEEAQYERVHATGDPPTDRLGD